MNKAAVAPVLILTQESSRPSHPSPITHHPSPITNHHSPFANLKKRILKILGYGLLGLILLIGLGLFLLSRPAVQQRLTGSVEQFLEKKIGTEVSVERVFVRFPKSLLLEGVYVEDERGDTLVFLGSLSAKVGLLDLLKNKITIRSVAIENTAVRIERQGGRSNFDFILEAFTQPTGAPEPPDTTAAAWVVDVAPAVFSLKNVAFVLNDNDLRQFIAADIGNFEAETDSADLPASRFVFKNLALADSRISFRQLAPPNAAAAPISAPGNPNSAADANPFYVAFRNAGISKSAIFYETTTLQLDAQLADAALENASFSTAADGALALSAVVFQLENAGNQLAYKMLPASPPTPRRFNPGDFDLRNLTADLRQFSFEQKPAPSTSGGFETPPTFAQKPAAAAAAPKSTSAGFQTPPTFALAAQVKSLRGRDKSGVELRALAGDLAFSPENLQVKNLRLRTGETHLEGNFTLRLDPAQPLEFFSADLDGKGKIGDLLAFVPPTPGTVSLEKLASLPFEIRGKAKGNPDRLQATNLRLALGGSTQILVTGNLQNLATPERMGGNFRIEKLHFEKNDFSDLLASQPILLPAFADLQGNVSGSNGRLAIDLTGQIGKLDSAAVSSPPLGGRGVDAARFDVQGTVQPASVFEKTRLDLDVLQLEASRSIVANLMPPGMVAPEQFSLTGKVSGALNDLLTDVKLTALRQQKTSSLTIEGSLKNAAAPDSLRFDLRFSGEVTKAEILGYVPDSLVTPVLNLPEKTTLDGWAKGSPASLAAATHLSLGNRGRLALDGSLRGENYEVKIVADDLKINQLAADSLLWQAESADFTATAEGSLGKTSAGFETLPTLVAEIRFDTLIWQGMALQNILATGSLTGKKFTASLVADDPRLAANLSANGDFGRPAPLLEWHGKIECLDLDAFGFTQKNALVCTSVEGRLEGLSPDTLEGVVRLQNLSFQYDTAKIAPGDLALTASLRSGLNDVSVESDWLRAFVRGRFDFKILPQMMRDFAYRYFQIPALALHVSDTFKVSDTWGRANADSLIFSLEILKPEIFTAGLIPNLHELGAGSVAGKLEMSSGRLNFDANLPLLEWERWTLHDLKLAATADGKQANLQIRAPQVEQFGESYAKNLLVTADFTGEEASARLVAADTFGGRERFRVGAFFRAEEFREGFTVHLATSQIIDYVAWSLPADNAVTLVGSDVRIKNLRLSNEQQALAIEGSSTLLKNGDRAVDFDLDIERLNLSNLALPLAAVARDLAGWVEGDFRLTGTLKNPQPRGSLTLHEASATPILTNVRYRFSEEPLRFVPEGIQISRLELTDPDGQKLSLSGYLRTENWLEYDYDLEISTRNWLALNTIRRIDSEWFGRVYVSATGSVRGSLTTPEITLSLKPEEGSEFTYIYDAAKVTSAAEGVVVFLSDQPPPDLQKGEQAQRRTGGFPFQLNLYLELDENLAITVIADPVTGDNFQGKLEGRLTLDIFPNGRISLAGRCEVRSGTYNYSYQRLFRRQFEVAPGSYVSFSGDPYNPDLFVSARYVVKASAYPLVGDRTTSLSEEEQSDVRSLQTFFLTARVTGNLRKPEVSFLIEYPVEEVDGFDYGNPDQPVITNAISEVNQNEAALSQQVFGLLMFKRFWGTTTDASTASVDPFRSGLNTFLTNQLNSLADQYFKWVEVDFEVEEDATYSGENQFTNTTNYRLQLQRSFFNDRLTFKVTGGTLVERENERETTRSSLQNLSVEYSLTPSGALKIRAFSEDGLELLDADRTRKSGLGFVLSREFKRFRLRKEKPQGEGGSGN